MPELTISKRTSLAAGEPAARKAMLPVNGPAVRLAGSLLRRVGRAVDALGVALQGKDAYIEKC